MIFVLRRKPKAIIPKVTYFAMKIMNSILDTVEHS